MFDGSVALDIRRQDGAFGFTDPAVPAEWTIEQVTERALPRLRYPATDVGSGRALKYSMLHQGVELPRDRTIGDAFPGRTARVHVVREYENA